MRFSMLLVFALVSSVAMAEEAASSNRGLFIQGTAPGAKAKDVVPSLKFWAEKASEGQDGTRNLVVEEKPVFKSGDKVWFKFSSNVDGYAYLANKGSDGKVNLLFPGVGGDKNKVQAGKNFTVPGEKTPFIFDSNPGKEQVVLVVAPKPIEELEKIAKAAAKSPTGAELSGEGKQSWENVVQLDTGSRGLLIEPEKDGLYVADKSSKGEFSKPVMIKLELEHK